MLFLKLYSGEMCVHTRVKDIKNTDSVSELLETLKGRHHKL